MPDLDSFLDVPESTDEPAPEPVAEPVAVETAPEEPKGETSAPPARELPPRGEDGKWIKAPEAPPPQQGHMVPLEALLAEREKRQAAERQAQSQQPKPDFWENPDAAVDARIEESKAAVLSEAEAIAEQRARQLFLNYTENAARGRYADYDAMREVFVQEAARNPALATDLRAAADPAEFIYRQGRTAAELREVGGDLSAYRKRIEAEIRQKVEQELAAKPRAPVPPASLNTEPSRGAGITGNANWAGPTPLEDILPNRRA